MPKVLVSGGVKDIISLAGVKGSQSLVYDRPDAALTFAATTTILSPNPKRVWALIQNLDTNDLAIALDGEAGTAPTLIIPADGIMQIDQNLPHTGAVIGNSATGNVTYIEVSVP